MIGIIEFKEDAHKENLHLAHRIKEELCELIDKLSKGEHGNRHYDPMYLDERRGGGRMGYREYPEQSDERRGGYDERRYILDTEPSYQNYPHNDSRRHQAPHHQFDGRYNY